MSQNVEIVGPNLTDQSTGDFHVHAAGCADLGKRHYDSPRNHGLLTGSLWLTTVESEQEIVEEIYSDFLPTNDDGEPTTWTDFEDTVHIFPCVKVRRQS
jgi:hypothetical protein